MVIGVEFVHVNVNGQITLPAKVRKRAGIFAGETLEVVEKEDALELRKVAVVEQRLLKKLESAAKARKITDEDIIRFCRIARKEIFKEESG